MRRCASLDECLRTRRRRSRSGASRSSSIARAIASPATFTTSDSLSFLNTVSLFKYAPLSPLLIRGELTWWHPILLIVIGLATDIAGLIHFKRRDLAS